MLSQGEKRKRILEINSLNISSHEKSKMIQELMNPKNLTNNVKSENKIFHCPHYKRYCYQLSKCCNKIYPCRLCHDENENHKINRHDIDFMKCIYCNCLQKVNQSCQNPDCFKYNKNHEYFCKKCNLWFDNEDFILKITNSYLITDIKKTKKTFHCEKCGICRLGLAEDFTHCDKCNLCVPAKSFASHNCINDQTNQNCPICLRSLWNTQNETTKLLDCGHCVHSNCCIKNIQSGNYSCAICKKSMIDLTDMWRQIDTLLESHSMPDEFKDWTADIYCNDCQKKTTTKYHFSYHKCQECGSYNTVVDNINKLNAES